MTSILYRNTYPGSRTSGSINWRTMFFFSFKFYVYLTNPDEQTLHVCVSPPPPPSPRVISKYLIDFTSMKKEKIMIVPGGNTNVKATLAMSYKLSMLSK